jgi:molybdate transport system permease protein
LPAPAPRAADGSSARGEGLRPLAAASTLLPFFLALPIVVLVASLSPAELLRHLRGETALRALWLTLRTTAVATVAIVVLGTPVAYLMARHRFRGRALLDTLIDLPVTIPPVVAGVALLLALGRRGLIGQGLEAFGLSIPFTTAAVVLAQVFIASPFYVKAARAGFAAVDPRLEEAARTLGSSPWRAFRTVTLPLSAPALMAGTVLAWSRALSEFGATMMFAGNMPGRTQTLTLAVMTAMESDLDTAVAVSTLSLALAVAALLAARAVAHRIAPQLG